MSKSISGLGTTDLTINELRLLGGTFTTLNTSDLFVTGTAQIGNIIPSETHRRTDSQNHLIMTLFGELKPKRLTT